MKYNVHLYTEVRVKVVGVEANSPEEAAKAAEAFADLGDAINRDFHVSETGIPSRMEIATCDYTDAAVSSALVDPLLPDGSVDFENTTTIDYPATGAAS